MELLLIEDDPRLADVLRRGLEEEDYAVSVVDDGVKALDWLRGRQPNLVLLDMMLPRLDGLSVLRELRGSGSDVPVLVLTARDELGDKVAGLNAGADDYLTKPFGFEELLARIRALLRRSGGAQTTLQVEDLELDTLKRTAHRGGRRIDLTNREYVLLEYLMRRAGQVVSREELAGQLEIDALAKSNVIDVHIGHLRRKVDDESEVKLLKTARGKGYSLQPPESDAEDAEETPPES